MPSRFRYHHDAPPDDVQVGQEEFPGGIGHVAVHILVLELRLAEIGCAVGAVYLNGLNQATIIHILNDISLIR